VLLSKEKNPFFCLKTVDSMADIEFIIIVTSIHGTTQQR